MNSWQIRERLDEMKARPLMWAGCTESLILQLALLIEFVGLSLIEANRFAMDQWEHCGAPMTHELGQDIVSDAISYIDRNMRQALALPGSIKQTLPPR